MMFISRKELNQLKKEAFFGKLLFSRVSKQEKKLEDIERKVDIMAAREEAAYARLGELVGMVRDGSAAKDAKIRELESALANADQDAVNRVNAALDQDSEFDADRIEKANAALDELVARASNDGDPVPDAMPARQEEGSATQVTEDTDNEGESPETGDPQGMEASEPSTSSSPPQQ
jgi:hypothetical protein